MLLEQAIKQPQFQNENQKIAVNLLYTASWFSTELSRVLRPFELSWQQFNIMRILKGQKGNTVSLKLVSERMIDRMSNTSRLVDKLVAKGYVNRESDAADRRQVALSLTNKGWSHLDQASLAVKQMSDDLFGHVCEGKLAELNSLLDTLRIKQSN